MEERSKKMIITTYSSVHWKILYFIKEYVEWKTRTNRDEWRKLTLQQEQEKEMNHDLHRK